MTDEQIYTENNHTKTPLLKVIRLNCIECCGGVTRGDDSPAGCRSFACNLWPYRLGKNPFSGHPGNPQGLEKAHASQAP